MLPPLTFPCYKAPHSLLHLVIVSVSHQDWLTRAEVHSVRSCHRHCHGAKHLMGCCISSKHVQSSSGWCKSAVDFVVHAIYNGERPLCNSTSCLSPGSPVQRYTVYAPATDTATSTGGGT
jgi:hypothetical protein